MIYDELVRELKKHGATMSMYAMRKAYPDAMATELHVQAARQSGARFMRDAAVGILELKARQTNQSTGRILNALAANISRIEID